MDYFYETNCFVKGFEIFGGELFNDGIIFDIWDILFDYIIKIKENYPNICTKNNSMWTPLTKNIQKDYFAITMPCNFSFCHDEEKIKKVKQYYYKFKENNIVLNLSWSHDGPLSINIREKRNNIDNIFYDRVFNLIKELNWGIHPMISKEGIDVQCDNYKWWLLQYQKYQPGKKDYMPCMLEVRNDGWDDISIKQYLNFLQLVFANRYAFCGNDPYETAKNIFCDSSYLRKNIDNMACGKPFSMDPLRLAYRSPRDNRMSCALGHSLVINCATLEIVPCHRLSYSQFVGGHFITDIENNKIVGIEANESVNGYFNQVFTNIFMKPGCSTCDNRHFCLGQCNGACYEYSKEACLPIPSVCELLNAKINFLVQLYHQHGLFKVFFETEEDWGAKVNIEKNNAYVDLLVAKGLKEYEQYRL